MTYVAFVIIISQENIVDVYMNFAAIIVVIEIDDIVGRWFETWMTPIKNQMAIKVKGFNVHYAVNSPVAVYSVYGQISGAIIFFAPCRKDPNY